MFSEAHGVDEVVGVGEVGVRVAAAEILLGVAVQATRCRRSQLLQYN